MAILHAYIPIGILREDRMGQSNNFNLFIAIGRTLYRVNMRTTSI